MLSLLIKWKIIAKGETGQRAVKFIGEDQFSWAYMNSKWHYSFGLLNVLYLSIKFFLPSMRSVFFFQMLYIVVFL